MYGVEAGGKGIKTGAHAASLCAGSEGVLHGALSYLLQDKDGQVLETHSISAGLDYPPLQNISPQELSCQYDPSRLQSPRQLFGKGIA